MKKNALVFLLASLMAFGLLLAACDSNGGGGSEAASVAGTTWVANMTRAQLAQILVDEGDFGSLAEAEAALAFMQIPETFPLARIVFAATGNTLRIYEYDLKDGTWEFQGTGTYTQDGNNLTVIEGGETITTTIVGGNRFDITEDGITLTFRRQ